MMEKRVTITVLLIAFSLVATLPKIVVVGAVDNSWILMEPMPTLRENFELVIFNDKIFVIGGSNSSEQDYFGIIEEYNIRSNSWVSKKVMPTPRSGFGTFVFQDRIYCVGGYSKETSYLGMNEVYDPISDTWEMKASIPTNRSGIQTLMVNGLVYFFGGTIGYDYENSETILSQKNEVYDPINDSWETKESIPVNGEFVAHVFGDKIYCIFKGVVAVYDTEENNWSQKTAMPIPATFSYYTVLVENKIYFLLPKEGQYTQIYNIENDTWSFGEEIPIELDQPTFAATSGSFAPTRIYMIGGFTDFVDPTNSTYVYDLTEDKWSLGASMTTSRYNAHVVVMDDIIYTLGGAIGFLIKPTSITTAVEKYIPTGYIPEFPSWTPLLVIVIGVLLISGFYRKSLNNHFQKETSS